MMFIRINVNHEENRTVVEKQKATNIFVIKNVFSQEELHIEKAYINVQNNLQMIIIVNRSSEESDPIGMI